MDARAAVGANALVTAGRRRGGVRRKGFTTATLDDIAQAAGYTKGAIYKHFAAKDELFLAVSERYWQRYFENFAEVMANATEVGCENSTTSPSAGSG